MFLGTPYLAATSSLLERPLSRSLKALHFSFKFFKLSFGLTDIVFLLHKKKNVLIIINEDRKINIRSNLKVFELFSLKVERRDEKVRDSGIIELMGPKNLFDIVKVRDSGVRDTKCNYKESY